MAIEDAEILRQVTRIFENLLNLVLLPISNPWRKPSVDIEKWINESHGS